MFLLTEEKVSSLIPTGKGLIPTLFQKMFCCLQNPFTYLELQSQMTPYFTEKMRKYFSVVDALFCLLRKTPSFIPTGNSQMHTQNLKKFFVPSLIWNWEAETHPVFTKILKNIFFDWGPWFWLIKKSFHLFGIGVSKRNLFQRKIFEKEQKNLPAGSGEQGILAFPYLNIGEKTFNST